MAWTCIKLLRFRFGRMRAMLLEGARQRKFAEAMTDHIFGYKNWVENFAVVHVEGQSDEIGRDHGAARPGLDRLLGLGFLRLDDFFEQVAVDKRTFFN